MIINIGSFTDLSGFHIIYNGTIKNESNGNRGISHIIEHLMCKTFEDLLDDFERNGITWNAYTSDTKIVFYITGLDEYLSPYRDKILDKLLEFDLSREDFDTEKKIILEEYSDTFNKQSNAHFLNLYRKLFDNYNPIGEKDDLKNIKIDDCIDYRKKYYYSPSYIVNVSKYDEYNRDISFNNFDNDYYIKYIPNNDFIYQKTNIFKSKTSVIYLSPIVEKDYPIISFITALLSNGLKSPLYQETREKYGLVYYMNCYLDQITDNNGVINISTETRDDNIDILHEKIKNVLKNKEKFITKERFDTVKTSMKVLYKKANINRYNSVNKFITPNKWLIEPVLDSITLDKVYDIYDEYFNIDNFYVSYDKKEFEKN
jgi:predicted Zn-dependent peptidase